MPKIENMSWGDSLICLERWAAVGLQATTANFAAVWPHAIAVADSLERITEHVSDPGIEARLRAVQFGTVHQGLIDLREAIAGGDFALALHLAPKLPEDFIRKLGRETLRLEALHPPPDNADSAAIAVRVNQIAEVADCLEQGPLPHEALYQVLWARRWWLGVTTANVMERGVAEVFGDVDRLLQGVFDDGIDPKTLERSSYAAEGLPLIPALGALVHTFNTLSTNLKLHRFTGHTAMQMEPDDPRMAVFQALHAKSLEKWDSLIKYLESHPLIQMAFFTYRTHGLDLKDFRAKTFGKGEPLEPRLDEHWDWLFRAPRLVFAG